MNRSSEATNITHGFTLLRELNSQRGMGQFCDCVLKLRVHPGRLFLAHKSVLAAFSPVLASLLPCHGALVDLNLPNLTPETLDILLDYIYTGALPLQSQEESVLSAAFHLQMDQLQQALSWRREAKITNNVQDKLSQKKRFVEEQTLDGTPLASPSYYPCGSDPSVSSSPSCEVVPVICHVRTAGNNKFPQQTRRHNRRSRTFNAETPGREVSKQTKESPHQGYLHTTHGFENSLLEHFFEPAQSKQDKFVAILSESSLNDLPSVPEKIGHTFSSSNDGELKSSLPENTILCSNTDSKDQCVHNTNKINAISSETEHSQTSNHSCPQIRRCESIGDRCVDDIDSIHALNPFNSGKGEHLVQILSGTFQDKSAYSTSSNIQGSHLCNQFAESTGKNEMTCEKISSDSDVWQEITQSFVQKSLFEDKPAETLTAEKITIEEKPQRNNHVESCEFSRPSKDYINQYQGQLHYRCMLERRRSTPDSSDSDSDKVCPVSNTEAKDTSMVLETIDITDISLSTSQPLKSPGERSTTHQFQCSMCNRAFSQRGSLNRHMRSHLGVRPYSCPQCSMTFSRQYRVTEHMRVHQRSFVGSAESHLKTSAVGMDVQ